MDRCILLNRSEHLEIQEASLQSKHKTIARKGWRILVTS
jgi:hypothetical protein